MSTVYEQLCTEAGVPAISNDARSRVVPWRQRPERYTAVHRRPASTHRGGATVMSTPLFDELAAEWTTAPRR